MDSVKKLISEIIAKNTR